MPGDRTITIEGYERLTRAAAPGELSVERRLCVEAMRLWIRLRDEVDEAIADRNRDRYKRLLRTTDRARERLTRRWGRLSPSPAARLGDLRIEAWPKPGGHVIHNLDAIGAGDAVEHLQQRPLDRVTRGLSYPVT